jgi:hypothetical protein
MTHEEFTSPLLVTFLSIKRRLNVDVGLEEKN